MSGRNFRRLVVRYDEDGAEGLMDGRIGKVSPRRAPAAELTRIASERSDDEHAPLAARTAFQRMQAIERGLHDTTSTLLRYVASRDDNEESALRVRVEELEALAEVEEALTTPQHVAQA